ncbi:MAG TPA: hypothetical protein VFV38_38765 [Ktedonobacteraceae bacterium]|nr:hypothetical protein [Ktedonobacteraceae bacterium]
MRLSLRSKLHIVFALLTTLVIITAAAISPLSGTIHRTYAQGTVTISEFPIPGGGNPIDITTGPDGNLWFTDGNDKIGRITPGGTITEYPLPVGGIEPLDITTGPDGNLWFTDQAGNQIGKITPSGTITEYPIPTASSQPWGITAGPDGNLWFTESGNVSKIGKITTSGVITEYSLLVQDQPLGITTGPDGNLWFAGRDNIWNITPSGAFTQFPLPADCVSGTNPCNPFYITAGPDGNLWFTDFLRNQVWKITTSGSMTAYPIPTSDTEPQYITAGPDGNVWFTEQTGNQIGQITPNGTITEYLVPTSDSQPFGITSGPDGNVWFTEFNPISSKIGRVNLSSTTPTPTPTATNTPTPSPTFTPTPSTTPTPKPTTPPSPEHYPFLLHADSGALSNTTYVTVDASLSTLGPNMAQVNYVFFTAGVAGFRCSGIAQPDIKIISQGKVVWERVAPKKPPTLLFGPGFTGEEKSEYIFFYEIPPIKVALGNAQIVVGFITEYTPILSQNPDGSISLCSDQEDETGSLQLNIPKNP